MEHVRRGVCPHHRWESISFRDIGVAANPDTMIQGNRLQFVLVHPGKERIEAPAYGLTVTLPFWPMWMTQK
jgi:hypothetical protein